MQEPCAGAVDPPQLHEVAPMPRRCSSSSGRQLRAVRGRRPQHPAAEGMKSTGFCSVAELVGGARYAHTTSEGPSFEIYARPFDRVKS